MGLVKGWLGAGGTLWEKNRARRARLGQTDVYLQPPEGYKTNSGQDYSLEFTQGLHPSFYAGMGYRFMNFRVANAHVLTVLADAHPRANLHLYIRYLPSRTLFGAGIPGVWNHSGWARLEWDIDRRFSPYVAFAVGSESFASFSVDKLGRFSAQTYGAGARINLNRRQGFRVGYFFQNRTLGRRQQSVSASWIFRF